jgi:hypothetical protein
MEDRFSRTENADDKVVRIGSHKDRISRTYRKKNPVRVQVEVASSEPVGEDIRTGLSEELGKLDGVVVLDDGPDWVYSIIALQHDHLVELSVILRQFFRASKPGTEVNTSASSDGTKLNPGAWVYESLKFHGLFGVRATDLKGLLRSLADEFSKNHLKQKPQMEHRGLSQRGPWPRTFPNS